MLLTRVWFRRAQLITEVPALRSPHVASALLKNDTTDREDEKFVDALIKFVTLAAQEIESKEAKESKDKKPGTRDVALRVCVPIRLILSDWLADPPPCPSLADSCPCCAAQTRPRRPPTLNSSRPPRSGSAATTP